MSTPDYVALEMECAQIMAMQEASGFPFDLSMAESVKGELACEAENLTKKILADFPTFPVKVQTPKRSNKTKSWFAGAPFTKLEDFNPTSRRQIAWALTTRHGFEWPKVTDNGAPKVDEAVLKELADTALQEGNQCLIDQINAFIRLLELQKHQGQLSDGAGSWLNTIEDDGCIHHSCSLATQTGRNAHRGPNLGQVVSAPWARQLFKPFDDQVMVGCDLEGLELRCLGHFLAPYDKGAFAEVVVNGDIHQQNADRVGCSRKEVKSLTYAFIYGAGDMKLGHTLKPELADGAKKELGSELRRKFLAAIPGLEPLIDAVKQRIRSHGRLKGLDGRPIMCDSEHKGLNFCLQSSGAILSKRWVVIAQQLLDAAGYSYGDDYRRLAYVHDEQQLSVREELVDPISLILTESAKAAGQYYNFRVPITASACSGDSWAATH